MEYAKGRLLWCGKDLEALSSLVHFFPLPFFFKVLPCLVIRFTFLLSYFVDIVYMLHMPRRRLEPSEDRVLCSVPTFQVCQTLAKDLMSERWVLPELPHRVQVTLQRRSLWDVLELHARENRVCKY